MPAGPPPVHQVQIYDSSWGGWRWYEGLTPKQVYSRKYALELAADASRRSFSFWYRVVNLNQGPIRVFAPQGYATGQVKAPPIGISGPLARP